MKKLLLSISVIFLFGVYSAFERRNPVASDSLVSPLSSGPIPTSNASQNAGYKDGQYTGDTMDAFYGNVQVQIAIKNGKISDVQFLQYPNDRPRSVSINSQAIPYLKSEAIAAQSANVDIVTGATDTSQAFMASLASALNKAR